MKYDFLKKFMAAGLSATMLIGGISLADLPSYNTNIVEKAYADTIKDLDFIASGTITTDVSMRKGPSTSYDRVVTLKKGTKVNIVAKSSNGWYKINYKDGYGYVYKDYVSIKNSDDWDSIIKYNATGITTHKIYVRKGPSTSADKLGVLDKNVKVDIVGKTSNGWYAINYKNSYAFVLGDYIKISNNQNQDTKYNATAVANHDVYVRKASSASSSKLGTLKKNDKVTIVAKSSNGWYKINYKNGYGYVYGKYLTINGNNDNEDIQYPVDGVANHDVYIRKSGSPSAKKLGILWKDTKVSLLSKTSNGWYKINYKDGTGYVYSQYINVISQK